MKVRDPYGFEWNDIVQAIRDGDPTLSHIMITLFNLQEVDNSQSLFSNEDVESLGRSLALSQHVKRIDFVNCMLETNSEKLAIVRRQMEELDILFKTIIQCNPSIKQISVKCNSVFPAMLLEKMVRFVLIPSVEVLHIEDIPDMWMCQVIGRCVSRRRTPLCRFSMQMDEERFLEFTDAFTEVDDEGQSLIRHLPQCLVIGNGRRSMEGGEFSAYSGWSKVQEILIHKDCQLKSLTIRTRTTTPREDVFYLARSLAKNETLLRVDLPRIEIDANGWNQLHKVICNKKSIDATLKSNHVIERITSHFTHQEGHTDAFQNAESIVPDMGRYLIMNRDINKDRVAWNKVLDVHFKDEYDIESYCNKDSKMIRFMVASVFDRSIACRDEMEQDVIRKIELAKLTYLYRVIKFCPKTAVEDKISSISSMKKKKRKLRPLFGAQSAENYNRQFIKEPSMPTPRRSTCCPSGVHDFISS